MSTEAAELTRRRKILLGHLGREISLKREHAGVFNHFCAKPAVLEKVNRKRAVISFGEIEMPWRLFSKTPRAEFGISGSWTVPIDWLLMPFSTEPDPKQIPLF